MTAVCLNCGAPLGADDRFCGECGTPVEKSSDAGEESSGSESQHDETASASHSTTKATFSFGWFLTRAIVAIVAFGVAVVLGLVVTIAIWGGENANDTRWLTLFGAVSGVIAAGATISVLRLVERTRSKRRNIKAADGHFIDNLFAILVGVTTAVFLFTVG